jgi:hypothetical protein
VEFYLGGDGTSLAPRQSGTRGFLDKASFVRPSPQHNMRSEILAPYKVVNELRERMKAQMK